MPLIHQWLEAAAKDQGGQRALVYRDSYLSWRGLHHRVQRRAQELSSMGIGRGMWMGLLLGNVPDLVVLILALDKLQAVSVPLDPATAARDMEMILDGAPMRATVTRPATNSTSPLAAQSASGRQHPTPLALRITDITRAAAPKHVPDARKRLSGTLLNLNLYKPSQVELELAAPSTVAYTTDAGGDPKGVLRDDNNLAAIAGSLGQALNAKRGQVALLPTPFHYSSGFDAGLVLGLAHGLTMVLEDEFSAKGLARLLKDNHAHYVVGTPAQYMAVCQTLAVAMPTPSALCLCVQSPGLSAAAAAFADKCGVQLVPMLHTAETGPIAIHLQGGKTADAKPAGQPLPGIDVRITAADGSPLKHGVKGQVWLQSQAISAAAVPQLPRAIRKVGPVGVPIGRTDAAGWFRTGDLGCLEPNTGQLLLTGREDDLVWVEGRRLALGEVEGCLESSKLVRQAEARVVYDDLAGPMVVARVVTAGPCRVEDIIDHCARNLAPYKVPRQIQICRSLDEAI